MDADASLESGLELKTKKVFEANLIFVRHICSLCVSLLQKGFHCFRRCGHGKGMSRYISGMYKCIVQIVENYIICLFVFTFGRKMVSLSGCQRR